MSSLEITIPATAEMDARRLALLVQTASTFDADIHLTHEERRINAKSLMGTMALRLAAGETVLITAEGKDEAAATETLAAFLKE